MRPSPNSAVRISAAAVPGAASGPQRSKKPAARRIRVILADDHPVVRRGLAACMAKLPQIEIVAEVADGREALRVAKELVPDIVLMDIDMPHLNGLTATELLRKDLPDAKVLILTMHSNTDYVMRILQSGARGYVLKQAAPEELLKAIETLYAGETYFSPDVARLALNQFVRSGGSPANQLSNREREVLVAIAEGLSNKEIACRLNVGVRTVETHRERIMRKLEIHSVAGLTKFAIQKGLIPLPKEPGQ